MPTFPLLVIWNAVEVAAPLVDDAIVKSGVEPPAVT
jgi:hypothetical protein